MLINDAIVQLDEGLEVMFMYITEGDDIVSQHHNTLFILICDVALHNHLCIKDQ